MTLTKATVLELMRDFTYKPNFQFEVTDAPDPWCAYINATMWVPDSTRPQRPRLKPYRGYGEYHSELLFDGPLDRVRETYSEYYLEDLPVIAISGRVGVHPKLLAAEFYTPFLRSWLRTMEDHELDEWFKVKGVCVANPHASDPLPV